MHDGQKQFLIMMEEQSSRASIRKYLCTTRTEYRN